MPLPHANGITHYLTHRGIPRSYGNTEGFFPATDDHGRLAYLRWTLGTDTNPDYTNEARHQHARERTQHMHRILAERYTVTEHPADTGWGGIYLRVTENPEGGLTPLMRTALHQIRQGGENYRYGPLTPSLNKPVPVKPSDLTPIVSGGLLGRTVLALERRGLVRLLPTTPQTGRVIAVPQDTEEQP